MTIVAHVPGARRRIAGAGGSGRAPGVRRPAAAVIALALCLSGCANDDVTRRSSATSAPPGAEPTRLRAGARPEFSVTKLAGLGVMLTGFAATADGHELVVGDRLGVVHRLRVRSVDGHRVPTLERRPLLDLSDQIRILGERGFFDLELVAEGRALLVVYTAPDGAITVVRYPYREGTPIRRADGRVVARIPWPFSWHHGGGMAVLRNGDVLLGLGDMEYRGFGLPGPQDPNLLLGGILRIPASVLADDAPSTTPTWRPTPSDMIARGFRNPWRTTVDRRTGDVWIGEVGLDTMEEVDRIPRDDVDSVRLNFGWPYYEGTEARQGVPPPGTRLEPPVFERHHAPGTVCGIVGGFVYRGSGTPALAGRYVYGDLCATDIRAFSIDDGRARGDARVATVPETPVSFGEDAAGRLYVLGSTGGLYRLDPPAWRGRDNPQTAPPGPTTTTIPRSATDCNGVVRVIQPLAEMGTMTGDRLRTTLTTTIDELARVVPGLPDFLRADGETVLRGLRELAVRLAARDWANPPTEPSPLSADILAGSGPFAGYPDAMARIIDSECK